MDMDNDTNPRYHALLSSPDFLAVCYRLEDGATAEDLVTAFPQFNPEDLRALANGWEA